MAKHKTASAYKRIIAFVIDMFIVSIIISICTVNTNTYKSRNDLDKKMNEFANNYVSGKISTDEYMSQYADIIYRSNKLEFNNNILYAVVLVGYFIMFQYMNDGRTIGKQLTKIKIVNKDNSSVRFHQLLIRSLIIDEILGVIVNILLVIMGNKMFFLVGYSLVSVMLNVLVFVTVFMVLYRKDRLGVHDIITKSKVIEDK